MTRALALAIALMPLPALADGPGPLAMPNPQLTPGAICITDVAKICATKWGRDERHVTQAMKEQVFQSYGIPKEARHLPNGKPAFEVDHLASRELGGCDSVPNLWPEPYVGPWNAHMKDRIENRLHVEVCAGRLSLPDAQRMIVTDWRAAFARYFGGH